MWNIVRHQVRASQVEVCQDQFTDVRVLAPDTNSNAGKCKRRVVIGRYLLLALFLLVTTHHSKTIYRIQKYDKKTCFIAFIPGPLQ